MIPLTGSQGFDCREKLNGFRGKTLNCSRRPCLRPCLRTGSRIPGRILYSCRNQTTILYSPWLPDPKRIDKGLSISAIKWWFHSLCLASGFTARKVEWFQRENNPKSSSDSALTLSLSSVGYCITKGLTISAVRWRFHSQYDTARKSWMVSERKYYTAPEIKQWFRTHPDCKCLSGSTKVWQCQR